MKADTHIDDLIKQSLIEEGLEKPSEVLGEKIMEAISATSIDEIYRPILPKRLLLAIPIIIVLCVAGIFLIHGVHFTGSYPVLNKWLDKISGFHITISLPSYITYGLLGSLILLLVQLVFVGRKYERLLGQK
ncbi:MAG TPA: hypothetical protein PLM81_13185 [Ginsengibacter sp.]|nr:hypothetical protein [Ginsengibacter sp.]HRP18219.1 hypothetical protein [Ginsengibacter sp.]HRP45055.1 hypothetical protein [Ginsengibacter sp.]